MAVNGFTNIVTDGLVLSLDAGNLKSYPTTGTTWTDLSKNGYNGTLTNMGTTGFSSSNLGSIVFDGTNDYVTMGNILNTIFTGTNIKFTLSVWCNKSSNTSTGSLICKYGDSLQSVNERHLYFTFESGKISLWTWGNPSNAGVNNWYRQVVTNDSFNTNTWYNVTTTYDGSINTNNGLDRVKIYINGILVPTSLGLINGTLTNTIEGASSNLSIGMSVASNNLFAYPFIGNISQSLIYNRVLSASEVLQNYNATKWRFI